MWSHAPWLPCLIFNINASPEIRSISAFRVWTFCSFGILRWISRRCNGRGRRLPRVHGSNERSPCDFGGERRSLWQDSLFFFFTSAALHQQVSPQTGRKMSKQRKQPEDPAGINNNYKKNNPKQRQLFSGWSSKLFCNRTTSPLPVCWDVSKQYSLVPDVHTPLKQQQKLLWSSRRHTWSLHLDNFAVQSFGNEKANGCQSHLCCLEECILVSLRCVILHDISIMRGTDIICSVSSAVLFKYLSVLFPERVNYN